MADDDAYLRRATKVVGGALIAVVFVVIVGTALVRASEIFLILFLGVLFGVFLSHVSRGIAAHTPLSYPWGLVTTTTLLVLVTIGSFTMFGMQVNEQINRAQQHVDEGSEQIREWAQRYPTVMSVLRSTPFLRQLVDDQEPFTKKKKSDENGDKKGDEKDSDHASAEAQVAEQSALRSTAQKGATAVAGVFKTTFGLVVNSMLIFFLGLFVAVEPEQYRDGVVKLFPVERRKRTREIMNLVGDTLWHWLLGRFATMLITGSGAGLLLLVLGVPMAFTLGVVTALMTFIPNIGGIVSLLLAILFAVPKGGTTVVLVIIGYLILQLVESYVITPLIQRKQVSLPPALLISAQAAMGVLFGLLGAAVASPFLAAAKVAIEEAYVKDVLESGRDV